MQQSEKVLLLHKHEGFSFWLLIQQRACWLKVRHSKRLCIVLNPHSQFLGGWICTCAGRFVWKFFLVVLKNLDYWTLIVFWNKGEACIRSNK
jgi:hypothetical protein